MAKKNNTQDPYEMELLDLLNEVGGTMTIEYHTAKLTLTKEKLQALRDAGYETDVMTCIMFGLAASLQDEEKVKDYLEEAADAGAAPSVSFEAAEGASRQQSVIESYHFKNTYIWKVLLTVYLRTSKLSNLSLSLRFRRFMQLN